MHGKGGMNGKGWGGGAVVEKRGIMEKGGIMQKGGACRGERTRRGGGGSVTRMGMQKGSGRSLRGGRAGQCTGVAGPCRPPPASLPAPAPGIPRAGPWGTHGSGIRAVEQRRPLPRAHGRRPCAAPGFGTGGRGRGSGSGAERSGCTAHASPGPCD